METVFDHEITQKELLDIVGSSMPSQDEYLKRRDEVSANMDLFYLFYSRGNKQKAGHYADKMPDPLMKYDLYRIVTHP